jgi:hypothetical protein
MVILWTGVCSLCTGRCQLQYSIPLCHAELVCWHAISYRLCGVDCSALCLGMLRCLVRRQALPASTVCVLASRLFRGYVRFLGLLAG